MTPNIGIDRSALELRSWVPAALHALAPGRPLRTLGGRSEHHQPCWLCGICHRYPTDSECPRTAQEPQWNLVHDLATENLRIARRCRNSRPLCLEASIVAKSYLRQAHNPDEEETMANKMTDRYLDNNKQYASGQQGLANHPGSSRSSRTRTWWSSPAWTRGSTWRICSACRARCRRTSAGDRDAAERRAQIIRDIQLLSIPDEAVALAEKLVEAAGVPTRAAADALHISIAACHGIDYLLTWNSTHIANAEFRPKVERACRDTASNLRSYAHQTTDGRVVMPRFQPEEQPWTDEIIAEVRSAGEELFAASGYDLKKFAERLRGAGGECRAAITYPKRKPQKSVPV